MDALNIQTIKLYTALPLSKFQNVSMYTPYDVKAFCTAHVH